MGGLASRLRRLNSVGGLASWLRRLAAHRGGALRVLPKRPFFKNVMELHVVLYDRRAVWHQSQRIGNDGTVGRRVLSTRLTLLDQEPTYFVRTLLLCRLVRGAGCVLRLRRILRGVCNLGQLLDDFLSVVLPK